MARILPDFLFPVRRLGREYHIREKRLFMKHFLNARQQLKSGIAKVGYRTREISLAIANDKSSHAVQLIFSTPRRNWDSQMSLLVT